MKVIFQNYLPRDAPSSFGLFPKASWVPTVVQAISPWKQLGASRCWYFWKIILKLRECGIWYALSTFRKKLYLYFSRAPASELYDSFSVENYFSKLLAAWFARGCFHGAQVLGFSREFTAFFFWTRLLTSASVDFTIFSRRLYATLPSGEVCRIFT